MLTVLTQSCRLSMPSPTEKALTASQGTMAEMKVGILASQLLIQITSLTTALTFEDFPQSDPVEEFFRTKFAPMINTPKYRILIGIVLVIWLIPAIVFVFKLEPTTQQEQFLSDDHPLQAQIL